MWLSEERGKVDLPGCVGSGRENKRDEEFE